MRKYIPDFRTEEEERVGEKHCVIREPRDGRVVGRRPVVVLAW